jgi:hypothetical protein
MLEGEVAEDAEDVVEKYIYRAEGSLPVVVKTIKKL